MSPRSLDPISRRPDKPDRKSGSSRGDNVKNNDIPLPHTADRDLLLKKAQESIRQKKDQKQKKKRTVLITILVGALVLFFSGAIVSSLVQKKKGEEEKQKAQEKQQVLEELSRLDIVKKLNEDQKKALTQKITAQYLAAKSVGLEPSPTNAQDQKLLSFTARSANDPTSTAEAIQGLIDAKLRAAQEKGYYEGYIFYYWFGNSAIVWPSTFNVPGRGDPAVLAADKQYATNRSSEDRQKILTGKISSTQVAEAILAETRLRSLEDPNGSGPISSSLLPTSQLSASGKVVTETIGAMDKPGVSDIKTLQYVSIYDTAKKPVDAAFFFVKLDKVVRGKAITQQYQDKLKSLQEQLK